MNLYFDGSVHYKSYWNDTSVAVATNVWEYDGLGRLKAIPGMIKAQTYETDGQTKSITYQNDVKTSFIYDENRRWLTRVYTVNAAGVWLMDSQYARDPAIGRIDRITGLTADENWQYYYDDLDRLTYAGNAGNWTRSEARPALRLGSGRSLLEKPSRWLFVWLRQTAPHPTPRSSQHRETGDEHVRRGHRAHRLCGVWRTQTRNKGNGRSQKLINASRRRPDGRTQWSRKF